MDFSYFRMVLPNPFWWVLLKNCLVYFVDNQLTLLWKYGYSQNSITKIDLELQGYTDNIDISRIFVSSGYYSFIRAKTYIIV